MGAVAAHLPRRAVAAGRSGGRGRPGDEHPLLALQRTAGNQAVASLVQRTEEKRFFNSKVALSVGSHLYEGKCDAAPKEAQVRHKWSRGLLGKDVAIIFECGPASFTFTTFVPYFDDRFPWGMRLVDGGSAFVTEAVSQALDDIHDDIDDPGSRFWAGRRVIVDLLTKDLEAYCHE